MIGKCIKIDLTIGLLWGGLFSAYISGEVLWQDDFNSSELNGWTIIDLVSGQKSNCHLYDGYLVHTSNIGGESNGFHYIISGGACGTLDNTGLELKQYDIDGNLRDQYCIDKSK